LTHLASTQREPSYTWDAVTSVNMNIILTTSSCVYGRIVYMNKNGGC